MAEDKLVGLKINEEGYGFVPKLVMQDRNINIAAKAVYAYFCSYTGAGNCCFPTRSKICYDLGISNDSLSKYLKQLVENGYLLMEQVKENGRFSHNVYTLPDTKLPCPKISDTEISDNGNLDTKSNSLKNNSTIKNNNTTKERKKESSTDTYDSIINEATEDEDLRELYREYIKMRKLNKSPMTNRALKMLIAKVKELEPNSIDRQKQLLETAIMHNWKSVYPPKDQTNGYAPPQGNQYGARREVINGKEYEVRNGKYYIPNGCNVAVDPFAEDDLAFLK